MGGARGEGGKKQLARNKEVVKTDKDGGGEREGASGRIRRLGDKRKIVNTRVGKRKKRNTGEGRKRKKGGRKAGW